MRHAGVAQVLAEGHPGLTAADDDDFDLFDAHLLLPLLRRHWLMRAPGSDKQ